MCVCCCVLFFIIAVYNTPPPLHSHSQVHPVVVAESDVGTHTDNITIRSDSINPKPVIISDCPGQHFQVSQLLLYLNSALSPTSDVLLDPYLLCWEELIK